MKNGSWFCEQIWFWLQIAGVACCFEQMAQVISIQWLEEKNCDICHFPTFARRPNYAITPGPIHKTTDNFSIPQTNTTLCSQHQYYNCHHHSPGERRGHSPGSAIA
jgi:hypothetical protein